MKLKNDNSDIYAAIQDRPAIPGIGEARPGNLGGGILSFSGSPNGGGTHNFDRDLKWVGIGPLNAAEPRIGEKYKSEDIPKHLCKTIADHLKSHRWLTQARMTTKGRGSCVGVTYDGSAARLGTMTRSCTALIREINGILAPIMRRYNMFWGSLQINVDSYSTKHVDKNNIGKSAMFTLGDYTGGEYKCADPIYNFSKPGICHIIDGSVEHWSEPFVGSRYSIVAFLHNTTPQINEKDVKLLLDLGFRLPGRPWKHDVDDPNAVEM